MRDAGSEKNRFRVGALTLSGIHFLGRQNIPVWNMILAKNTGNASGAELSSIFSAKRRFVLNFLYARRR
jgi:hypothetical protein